MLTSPITTPSFHTRVLTIVSNYITGLDSNSGTEIPVPTIPSLSPVDTPLAPGDTISHILGVVSPWIDLCSPDPVIYCVSRQVLELEVAYAAFCGVGNIILPSPKLHHGKLHGEGITQYAYAIQRALQIAQYIQLSIVLPMMDDPEQDGDEVEGSLANEARAKYMGLFDGHSQGDSLESSRRTLKEIDQDDDGGSVSRKKSPRFDFFGTWDAWNVIRTLCTYNARLFVGKNRNKPPLQLHASFFRSCVSCRLSYMLWWDPRALGGSNGIFPEVLTFPCYSVKHHPGLEDNSADNISLSALGAIASPTSQRPLSMAFRAFTSHLFQQELFLPECQRRSSLHSQPSGATDPVHAYPQCPVDPPCGRWPHTCARQA